MKQTVGIGRSPSRIADAYDELRAALSTPVELSGLVVTGRSEEGLAAARVFWSARMMAEHRSVQVFTQLALQLLDANALLDATAVTLRMAADELLHTETCGKMVEALGRPPFIETDVEVVPIATHAGCTPEQRALRNVVYATCLSEMVAVARLADSLELATDPAARSAIRSILADEVLHGQFGFLYLEGASTTDEHRADLAEYLVHAFAVLEEELAPAAMARARAPHPDAVALGVLVPQRAYEVFHATIAEAIVPGLEARGIEASSAWRRRQRLA